MRNPVHLDLDRDGHLLLNFFSCAAGPLGDHLHPGVRDIGIRFDRQLLEGNDAPDEKQKRHAQNNKAIVERKVDEPANHCCSTVFWSSKALATTCCPGLIPLSTSCRPPRSMSPLTTSTRRNSLSLTGT